MKSKIVHCIIICFCCSFLFVTCTKEKESQNPLQIVMSGEGILEFENVEEFIEIMNEVNGLDSADLIDFQADKLYTSFGLICDILVFGLVIDSLTQDSLIAYVEAHNEYITYEINELGEYIVNPFLFDNGAYYLMNENRMYIIGDTCYKVFAEGTLLADLDNYEDMVSIAPSQLEEYIENCEYVFFPSSCFSKKKKGKDITYDLGRDTAADIQNGNQKTFVWVKLIKNSSTSISYQVNIDAKRRFLGIWWPVKRTYTGSFSAAIDLVLPETTQYTRVFNELIELYVNTIIPKPRFTKILPSYTIIAHSDYHFAAHDSWGKTPSTNKVYLTINASLIP
jgi:hypothetical protein